MASSNKNSSDRLVPILVGVVVLLAFGFGVLWQKVDDLGGGSGVQLGSGSNINDGPTNPGDAPPSAPSAGKLDKSAVEKIAAISPDDHLKGNRDAKVIILEYSDLQCPYCSSFHGTAQQAVEDYGGDVAWVYRHFPLDSIHPKARPGAIGAECAANLGGNDAFWSFVDAIFEDQGNLDDLGALASNIGLNKAQFESCLTDTSIADKVESQYQSGLDAGVTGTPGNFILNSDGDAWLVAGAVPITQLKATIDQALGN